MKIGTNKSISIAYGDTFNLTVNLTIGKVAYTLEDGESVVLNIKKQISQAVVKTVTVENTGKSTVEFYISDEDMESLAIGYYVYDIYINRANGAVETLINPPAAFTIKEIAH